KRGEKEGVDGEKPLRKRKGGAVLEGSTQAAIDQGATLEEVTDDWSFTFNSSQDVADYGLQSLAIGVSSVIKVSLTQLSFCWIDQVCCILLLDLSQKRNKIVLRLTVRNSKLPLPDHHTPISTLVKGSNPNDERFSNFKVLPAANGLCPATRIQRSVRRDGVAKIYVSHSLWQTTAKGEELRLCPYFDPMTRTLRCQFTNDLDSAEEKPLAELIWREGCQPLLHLAYAENLIDKVPGRPPYFPPSFFPSTHIITA
ncbi:hypothetical protein FRB97_004332, partial [Tulasnella sp. 331]